MSVVEKATSAAGFLSMVPAILGYLPTESIVAIPFDANNRTVAALRIDLPESNEIAVGAAPTIVGMMCKVERAVGVAFVIYSERRDLPDVLVALCEQLERVGLRCVDLAVVSSTGYASKGDDFVTHPISNLSVPDHLRPLVTAGDQATLPTAEPVEGVVWVDLNEDQLIDLISINESFFSPREWDAESLSILATFTSLPSLRDIMIVQLIGGSIMGAEAYEAQLDWEDGAEYPREIAMVMWGEAKRPNPERLDSLLVGCLITAASTEGKLQVGAYATVAWLNWALGRSTLAEQYAQRALDIDPDHGLSQIVASFVTAGHLPEWAFSR